MLDVIANQVLELIKSKNSDESKIYIILVLSKISINSKIMISGQSKKSNYTISHGYLLIDN